MHAAPSNTLYGLLHRVASKQDSREGRFEELPGLPTEEPTEQANHRRGTPAHFVDISSKPGFIRNGKEHLTSFAQKGSSWARHLAI